MIPKLRVVHTYAHATKANEANGLCGFLRGHEASLLNTKLPKRSLQCFKKQVVCEEKVSRQITHGSWTHLDVVDCGIKLAIKSADGAARLGISDHSDLQ